MYIMCVEKKGTMPKSKAIVIARDLDRAKKLLVENFGDSWKDSERIWSYPLRESNQAPSILETY